MTVIQLKISPVAAFLPLPVHDFPVKDRHGMGPLRKARPPRFLPAAAGRDCPQRSLDRGASQIGGHLRKPLVKIEASRIVPCRVDHVLRSIEPFLCVSDPGEFLPDCIQRLRQVHHGPAIDVHRLPEADILFSDLHAAAGCHLHARPSLFFVKSVLSDC